MSTPAEPNFGIIIPPLPSGFSGSQDNYSEFLEENLDVELPDGQFLVGVGTILPGSNIGPFLLVPNNLWYVWDDTTGKYIPQTGSTTVGEVNLFGNVNPPDTTKWVGPTDGRAIPRAAPYDKLYAAYGTKFGNGDGSTTFNIPHIADVVDSGGFHLSYYVRYA